MRDVVLHSEVRGRGPDAPPDTGGRNAISSPSDTVVSMRAYSRLRATETDSSVWRQLGVTARELSPYRPDGRGSLQVQHELTRSGNLPQAREETNRYAHARLSASARALSSSGSAVAPSSIDDAPPSKCSCFQMGTICFTRSIA